MRFGGIQKTSTIDFPGVLSCVLFTRGCDLNCFYCHNRELIEGIGPEISEDEALSFLRRRQGLLDGVVVSGGEPTLQPDLSQFLNLCKGMGYKLKLDTNGQRPGLTEQLWQEELLNYIAVDVKAPEAEYAEVCGVSGFEKTRETILALLKRGAHFEARTTLYPGLSIEKLEELLSSFPVLPLWRMNYFKMPEQYCPTDEKRLKQPALTPVMLKEALPFLQRHQPNLAIEK